MADPVASPAGGMIRGAITEVQSLTPEIRMLTVAAVDGSTLPEWTAGAHIRVGVGDGTTRSYSLVGSEGDRHVYRICVRRDDSGRGGSAWMHALAVGDEIAFHVPRNDFRLSENAELHTLIAGGIGITPLYSMALKLAEQGARSRMIYCARSPESAIFLDELRSRYGPHLLEHYDNAESDRVFDFTTLLETRDPGEHVYVCGPAGLIRAVRGAAGHWPDDAVHFELFGADGNVAATSETASGFDIELARSGETLHVPPGKSILRVLLDHGLPIEYYCEEGTCGLCTTNVLSGRISHRDHVLSDREKASQTLMQVCVSGPEPGERLVLDL